MSVNKKIILNTVLLLLVIALLGGAVWYLSRPDAAAPDSGAPEDEKITVYSINPADMLSAKVTNQYGSYALRRVNGSWSLDGFEGMTLDSNMLDALVNTFSNVTSAQLIDESPENAGDYGLFKPETVLSIGSSDGERTFYIGNETPDGSSYYFSTDASDSVYIMDSYVADVAFLTARDYVDLGDSFSADAITGVSIVSSSGKLRVRMDPDGERDQYGLLSYWDILEPEERSASNSDVVTLITTPLSELESTASGIYEDTAEERAELGLDAPEFTVEVETEDRIDYIISHVDGEYRYIHRGDSGYILRVDSDAADFAYTSMEDISEKYLAMIDIATLRSVDMTSAGKTLHFTVVDGAGDNAAFYVGSNELAAEDFRAFYQQIIALQVGGVVGDAPLEGSVGSITYTLISGDSLTLEFAPYDDRSYGVYINGKRQYTMLRKNVDKLFDLMTEF